MGTIYIGETRLKGGNGVPTIGWNLSSEPNSLHLSTNFSPRLLSNKGIQKRSDQAQERHVANRSSSTALVVCNVQILASIRYEPF